ncbi:hypothetical protein D187_007878 [Cystobacter fuscus DSM 2262]|uniref:Uncharacterized protein n=1 Tax=Cystobacter fuscus (strain ATCC 25194 / DSM 2262 / NBRC 100088 / M29) TaxID=1242864 RepID=S9P0A0_CYSF2|nr:hypothetical protein D187_007878 [Cystobacter fuscus DSM 2262]
MTSPCVFQRCGGMGAAEVRHTHATLAIAARRQPASPLHRRSREELSVRKGPRSASSRWERLASRARAAELRYASTPGSRPDVRAGEAASSPESSKRACPSILGDVQSSGITILTRVALDDDQQEIPFLERGERDPRPKAASHIITASHDLRRVPVVADLQHGIEVRVGGAERVRARRRRLPHISDVSRPPTVAADRPLVGGRADVRIGGDRRAHGTAQVLHEGLCVHHSRLRELGRARVGGARLLGLLGRSRGRLRAVSLLILQRGTARPQGKRTSDHTKSGRTQTLHDSPVWLGIERHDVDLGSPGSRREARRQSTCR